MNHLNRAIAAMRTETPSVTYIWQLGTGIGAVAIDGDTGEIIDLPFDATIERRSANVWILTTKEGEKIKLVVR